MKQNDWMDVEVFLWVFGKLPNEDWIKVPHPYNLYTDFLLLPKEITLENLGGDEKRRNAAWNYANQVRETGWWIKPKFLKL